MKIFRKSKFFSKYLPVILTVILVTGSIFVFQSKTKEVEAGWYSSGGTWSYRKAITVDSAKVSGTSNLTNFPMLFSVTDADLKFTGSGGKVASSTGGDIVFTSADGTTKLSHEIESYASTTGETIIWVKIPTLKATSDTVIYIYYGNASASYQPDPTGVWDANYKGVWHLGDGDSTATNFYKDSTSNADDGTLTDVDGDSLSVSGNIDGAMDFNGDADYIQADNVSLPTGDFTYNAWVNLGSNTDEMIFMASNGTGGNEFFLYVKSNNTLDVTLNAADNITGTTSLGTGTDYYASVTRSGSTVTVYLNGSSDGTGSSSATLDFSTCSLLIAADADAACTGTLGNYLDGVIDEARVSNIARSANWIATEYNNQSSPSTFYAYGAEGVENRATSTAGVFLTNRGWYNKSWGYRKKITIDKFQVSSTTDTTLFDFPILFNSTDTDLKFTGSGGKVASSTGGDIVFTSADGTTKLSHEIESYASTTGETIAWVKIPYLSTTVDTDIYIYYGNSSATYQPDPTGVWDSNYKLVQHLSEDPSGTAPQSLDSTSNNNGGTSTGSMTTSDQVTGQIDGSLDFDGSNDFLNISDSSSWDNITTAITIEAWVKANSGTLSTRRDIIQRSGVSAPSNDWWFNLQNSGKLSFYADNITGGVYKQSTNTISEEVLHHVVVSYDDANDIRFYIDGVLDNTVVTTGSFNVTDHAVAIGANKSGPSTFFGGIIDEVRVSNIVRSADWIATEYNNQNSPSTFYSIGSEQTRQTMTDTFSNWYSSSWSDRKQIVIDADRVSGTSNLTDFPMLFSVTDSDLKFTSFGGKVASSTGGDILFTLSDGKTKLSHEIEKYASTTGETIVWVKIPTLSGVTDTVIYIYYGNASASYQPEPTSVWDSNYKGVWHLGEDPSGTAPQSLDSTSNNNDGTSNGTMTASDQVTGQVDGSLDFDNSDDYVLVKSGTIIATETNVSVFAWISTAALSAAGGYPIYAERAASGNDIWKLDYADGITTDEEVFLTHRDDAGTLTYIRTGTNLSDSVLHHVGVTKSGTSIKIYVDGVEKGSGTLGGNDTMTNAGLEARIGGDKGDATADWSGIIDEVRVSNTARSADWIVTEYNNQNSPSTFYAYSASQTENRQDSSGNSAPAVKLRGGVKFR